MGGALQEKDNMRDNFNRVYSNLAKAIAESAADHDFERETDELIYRRSEEKRLLKERKKYDAAYKFIIERPHLIYTSQIKGLIELIKKVKEKYPNIKNEAGRSFWLDCGE